MLGIIDRPERPSWKVFATVLLVLGIGTLLLLATRPDVFRDGSTRRDAPAGSVAPAPAGPIAPHAYGPAIGFRTRELLVSHFQKHGHEFDASSPEGYLVIAQALRDRPVGGDVLEARRADGVITRFERSSGTFLAFDADGVIRTCFRPNFGEAYFRRQARRPAP